MDTSDSPLTALQRDVLMALGGVPGFYLSGGAALSLVYLQHRQSLDLDLFTDSADLVPRLVNEIEHLAAREGWACEVRQRYASFCRLSLRRGDEVTLVDVVHDTATPLVGLPDKPVVLGVPADDLDDLVVNKLCALLGRGDVKDLVDLYFLSRAGHDPLAWLERAQHKDGGMEPASLAFVLKDVPTSPASLLLLKPVTEQELRAFRDDLVERLASKGWPEA